MFLQMEVAFVISTFIFKLSEKTLYKTSLQ